jgi:hypothetical protein
MKTIHKYPLQITDRQKIETHSGFKPLHVGLDPSGNACLWCQVNTERPKVDLVVFVVGTGNPMPEGSMDHFGSFIDKPYVWHVFLGAYKL